MNGANFAAGSTARLGAKYKVKGLRIEVGFNNELIKIRKVMEYN